jgi:hypothetical protein
MRTHIRRLAVFLLVAEAGCAGDPTSVSSSADTLTATKHRRATLDLAISKRSCEDSSEPGSHPPPDRGCLLGCTDPPSVCYRQCTPPSPWPSCSTGDFRFSLDVDVDDTARTIAFPAPFASDSKPITQAIAPDGTFVVSFEHFFTYRGSYLHELPAGDTTGARDVWGTVQADGKVGANVIEVDSFDLTYSELHGVDGSPLTLSENSSLDKPVSGQLE